jgi:hypothetical protein
MIAKIGEGSLQTLSLCRIEPSHENILMTIFEQCRKNPLQLFNRFALGKYHLVKTGPQAPVNIETSTIELQQRRPRESFDHFRKLQPSGPKILQQSHQFRFIHQELLQ